MLIVSAMKSTVAILFLCCAVASAQQRQLTDQGIVDLTQSGLSQAEIVRIIGTVPKVDFDLRPVSTDAMIKNGVSEDVIKAMAARESKGDVELAHPVEPPPKTSARTDSSSPTPVRVSTERPIFGETGRGGYKLTYDGGSITNLKAGAGMKMFLGPDQIRIVKNDVDLISLPASAITEISYGQDVHRRVGAAIGLAVVSFGIGALMALTKSKKHFIGLTWDDAGAKGGAAFQADKNEYRGVLAGLEGITGKKAVNSEAMTVKN